MALHKPEFLRAILKQTEFWRNNKLLLREIRRFPGIIASVLVLSLLAGLFEAFGISFLLAFLQKLVEPGGEPFSTGFEWFDVTILGINSSPVNQLYRVSGLILLSTILRVAFSYAGIIAAERGGVRLVNNLYKKIFEQLQSLSLEFYGQTKTGEIINTLTVEITQTRQAVGTFSNIFIRAVITAAYVVMAMRISWPLTSIAVVLFSIAAASITTLNKYIRESSFPLSVARGKLSSIAVEFITGIRTVQAFATQDFERNRFYHASDQVEAATMNAVIRFASVKPIVEALASVILVGIIVLGMTIYVPNGSLQVASLLTFIFILVRMTPAVQEISGRFAELSNLQGAIHNIENFLRVDDKPYLQNGYRSFGGLQKAIELVAVDFGYTPEEPVIQGITLAIPKGQTVALVGASGAGKSTLADLIARFYDPTQGQLLLDGIDLREFDITSVRQKMAIVSQETFIFNATVRGNIAYGLDNISDKDVFEAARLANALEFIESLPEGLETVLGDRGVRLSGGQRQRIAIARALLRNPEILILDEATSALDSVSERLIQQSLEELSVGRTVIAIAHRLSTIMRADKVVVMEKGHVVEQGTYQELLGLRGELWKYHQMQQGSKNFS
ncbi:ABC transporter ATP-binding protein [Nodosilinea sp. LEGE 06152]|uniref:heterocyst formation ABC transporter subunit HepA n=1 Tax=Nodosilinea sp. LEGE 06152 TaxID=2777966 RepID=UPI00187E6010|nr:heterocyst formation ABC transporter subunit HepA [Nodosilinea sp. LEGE 06152]MBE9155758.1 ABC transporter ATP-binding protein [Nodosilinea sp. LEGE 06152]